MSLKVVYIDDELDLLSLFAETFSSPDIEIRTFSDVREAKASIAQDRPDLVLIDFRLPGITGDKVAEQLDAAIPKALITGDLNVQTSYRFDAMFEKPYKPQAIEEFLQSIKNKKSK